MEFKFIINNVFKPEGKLTIHLGDSSLAKGLLKYFNKRILRKGGIKNKKYNCAVIRLDKFKDADEYRNSIKGKNSADYFARRCTKLGYTFQKIDPNQFIDDIFEIHTSASERQGRKMEESYLVKVERWPNDHENNWFGVFNSTNKLVGYIWLVKTNELGLMNRILGHNDHLKQNIMYLLAVETIANEIHLGEHKIIMYDTFGAKKNGLVLFKNRIGFKPYTIHFVK
ncbi:hypothetical protein H9Y05_05650 [Crocinitomicaceae bacterium CZZ-1]|uniref:Uncharacterized protein n=1 Tax=Taishania pollutisoli TaxID=2766479 RepID=A0A8J6PNV7_9FLAO|nr:hypothetical protein [Taishania pollutisoli]MBC9811958.1 hypothetical protein [Taishania pollutisoli]